MASVHLPFFTIGHSSQSLDDFVQALQHAGVTRVIDVRSITRSRANPQFNADSLPAALAAHGIGYQHIAALGGRRGRQRNVDPAVDGLWRNASFHNYADWAQQTAFASGLNELIAAGRRERCAIMCAESLWWRCHRRIITDHLLARGETVRHIIGQHIDEATLTPGAVVHPDGAVTYPPSPSTARPVHPGPGAA